MPESFNFFKKKENKEASIEEVNSFINTFIVDRKNLKQEFNKKELFNSVQAEWFSFLKEQQILNDVDLEKTNKELIKDLTDRLSKTKSGFVTTPKMHELLPPNKRGLECLSVSMALASVLDKKEIEYNFIAPVGHIALEIYIDDKKYYIDPRNNKVLELDKLVQEEILESKSFDLVKLKDNHSKYSFYFRYKNKEDILKFVFSNLSVLNNLNHGKKEGASLDLKEHEEVANLLKTELNKIDFKTINNFESQNYDSFYERNKALIKEEEKRVYGKE